MTKLQRSGETIGTIIDIPKKMSLQLSRLIIDRSEKGEKVTKPELIIEYIKKGLEQDGNK